MSTAGPADAPAGAGSSTGRAVIPLAVAQFIMVLDSSVMSVSISQLVEEFDTTVSTIQLAITLYALVMAALMLTGGKIGDLFGRLRVFRIGLVIYAVGSLMTALAPTVGVLIIGWSFIEGAGAALVLPALAALVAGSYPAGKARARAYGIIGGVAGAGIAIGPLVGGWLTTTASWRWVFAGEVVFVVFVLVVSGWIAAGERGKPFRLDGVGALLSASGLALVVFGVLRSGTWGWIMPLQSPIEPFGFALTPFVIAAGLIVLWAFFAWERALVDRGRVPLLDVRNLRNAALRAGLMSLLAQSRCCSASSSPCRCTCRSRRASMRSRPVYGCCPPRSRCSWRPRSARARERRSAPGRSCASACW